MELSDTQLIVLSIALIGCLLLINKAIVQPPYNGKRQNFFCGLKPLPNGFSRYGNRYECLKRGFGGGLHKVMRNHPYRSILTIILAGAIIFLFICRLKSNTNNNRDGQ